MTTLPPGTRLWLVSGATLIFLGGLLVAIGRWNDAQTDRAFVEAATLAVRAPPAPGGVRFWAPDGGASPGPAARVSIEAAERLRQRPDLPAQPPIQFPGFLSRPVPTPQGGPLPNNKPPAAPR